VNYLLSAAPVTSTAPTRSTDPAELQPSVRPDGLGRFGPFGGQIM